MKGIFFFVFFLLFHNLSAQQILTENAAGQDGIYIQGGARIIIVGDSLYVNGDSSGKNSPKPVLYVQKGAVVVQEGDETFEVEKIQDTSDRPHIVHKTQKEVMSLDLASEEDSHPTPVSKEEHKVQKAVVTVRGTTDKIEGSLKAGYALAVVVNQVGPNKYFINHKIEYSKFYPVRILDINYFFENHKALYYQTDSIFIRPPPVV